MVNNSWLNSSHLSLQLGHVQSNLKRLQFHKGEKVRFYDILHFPSTQLHTRLYILPTNENYLPNKVQVDRCYVHLDFSLGANVPQFLPANVCLTFRISSKFTTDSLTQHVHVFCNQLACASPFFCIYLYVYVSTCSCHTKEEMHAIMLPCWTRCNLIMDPHTARPT